MLLLAEQSYSVVAERELLWACLKRIANRSIHLGTRKADGHSYVAIEQQVKRIAFHVVDEIYESRKNDRGRYFSVSLVSR